MGLLKHFSSDRISVGVSRLAIVVMVVTTGVICWRQAETPYAEMQSQVFAISLDAYSSWSADIGTPVYYGSEAKPQQLQVNVELPGSALVVEPKIKSDETVNCLRKYPNSAVRVVDRTPSLGELLSTNPLPYNFVLFDTASTANAVVQATSPTTLDFQAVHPDAKLDVCLSTTSMKAMAQARDSIAAIKRDFYLGSASLLGLALGCELAFFLLLYWILRGFFGGGRTA